jgi:hypothetical protein
MLIIEGIDFRHADQGIESAERQSQPVLVGLSAGNNRLTGWQKRAVTFDKETSSGIWSAVGYGQYCHLNVT